VSNHSYVFFFAQERWNQLMLFAILIGIELTGRGSQDFVGMKPPHELRNTY